MINNSKIDLLNSGLPDTVQLLNKKLLLVNWSSFNLDSPEFANGLSLNVSLFNIEHQALISLILELIPEWQRIVNCKQHPTHDYSLDIHTFMTIKKLHEDDEFRKLNEYEKLVLLYTGLLHDIEKIENEVDPAHPIKGAEKSGSILYRLGFNADFINDVYVLIKNHQILGLIASKRLKMSNKDLAEILKRPELIILLTIFAIADIKSVKKEEAFFCNSLKDNLESLKISMCNYFQNYK